MFYYKKSFDSVPIENRDFRKPEIDYFEELYFFYFFSVIELIFVVINKCFVLINECLELGINNKQNSSFETSIANALRNNENINNLSEIKDLENIYLTIREVFLTFARETIETYMFMILQGKFQNIKVTIVLTLKLT